MLFIKWYHLYKTLSLRRYMFTNGKYKHKIFEQCEPKTVNYKGQNDFFLLYIFLYYLLYIFIMSIYHFIRK